MKTITTGSDLDSDGYILTFASFSASEEVPIGASDSLWISEVDLPARLDSVSLHGIAANCWLLSHWRRLAIRSDATTRVEFSIECMPWAVFNSGITYDRVSPNFYGQSEQYILLSNNRFRLRFLGGDSEYEILGAYHSSDSRISFWFDSSPRTATGTLSGDSLFVEYNFAALDDGFESGLFIRSPGAP